MLTLRQFEAHFYYLSKPLLEIALELRNLVAQIAPQAVEELRRNGVVYYDSSRGGPVSAGICQIMMFPDHIRLAFIHGAFLPDPEKLLTGTCRYKKYVRLSSFEETPWEEVIKLITASSRYDPYSKAFIKE